jgi:hypothetical protein
MYSLSGGYFASCAFAPATPKPISSKNSQREMIGYVEAYLQNDYVARRRAPSRVDDEHLPDVIVLEHLLDQKCRDVGARHP